MRCPCLPYFPSFLLERLVVSRLLSTGFLVALSPTYFDATLSLLRRLATGICFSRKQKLRLALPIKWLSCSSNISLGPFFSSPTPFKVFSFPGGPLRESFLLGLSLLSVEVSFCTFFATLSYSSSHLYGDVPCFRGLSRLNNLLLSVLLK